MQTKTEGKVRGERTMNERCKDERVSKRDRMKEKVERKERQQN